MLGLISGACPARADTGIEQVKRGNTEIAQKIMKDIRDLSGNICVLDFSPPGNDVATSEFGQFVAESLATELMAKKKKKSAIKIVERRQLIKIMKDSLIFGNDPDLPDKLVKMAGMDYLVSGTYHPAEDKISVEVRVVSAKAGEIVSSGSFTIPLGEGLAKMISRKIRSTPSGEPEKAGEQKDKTAGKLSLDVALVFLGGDGRLRPVHEGMSLTSKDNYALYLKSDRECYVYAYQVDSTNKAARLFPNPGFKTAANPLEPDRDYWAPNDREFFFLDEITGMETIYVVATGAPVPALEDTLEIELSGLESAIKTIGDLTLMGVGGKRSPDIVVKAKPVKGNSVDVITKHLKGTGNFWYKLSFMHD